MFSLKHLARKGLKIWIMITQPFPNSNGDLA